VTEPSERVSDAEREEAVASLREHLLAGRLTLDEFSERVELAYRARVGGELASLRDDLPDVTSAPPSTRRKPTRLTAAIFGNVTRRGRLRLGERTAAISAFADLDLDLREAQIENTETVVTVLTAFGNADVYVPEGVNVEVGGIALFGHSREWGRDAARPDAPTLRIRTLGAFGTIDVWRVPHDMQGGYREVVNRLQAQERELPA
jgi:hypothetical protein